MTPASGSRRPRKGAKRAEPFIIEATRDGVAVYRRPVGNLAIPRLCGVLPTRPVAVEFARLLRRAETAAPDLFLEATDDGIEALEAVIAACLESATSGAAGRQRGRARSARNGRGGRPRIDADEAPTAASDGADPGEDETPYAGGGPREAAGRRNGGRRRGRRGRGGRRGEPGGEGPSGGNAPSSE